MSFLPTRKGPLSRPFSTLCLKNPVFTVPPRFRFGFWDCYLLRLMSPTHPLACLLWVESSQDVNRREQNEFTDCAREPPLPPRRPPPFPVSDV